MVEVGAEEGGDLTNLQGVPGARPRHAIRRGPVEAGGRAVAPEAVRPGGLRDRVTLSGTTHGPWSAYAALIGMVVPLAAGVLGSVTVSTPSLKLAITLLPSTALGRRIARTKLP
jgi:hypothetical protein